MTDASKIKLCRKGLHNFVGHQCKECHDAWRAANYDKVRATVYAWNAANHDRVKENATAWQSANPEKIKALATKWHAANPDAARIYAHNRRALKNQCGGKLSHNIREKLFKLQKGKCACCKKPLGDDCHLDHIVPLSKGGSNTDDNIQLLTQRCNNQKHAKDPIDFMQSRGFLI